MWRGDSGPPPSGHPEGRGTEGPGGALRSRPALLPAPRGRSRQGIGAGSAWATRGLRGQRIFRRWKVFAEAWCLAARSAPLPPSSSPYSPPPPPPAPRDLGQSGPTPDAWSGARVPAEPELPAWRLFSLPPLRCPGARGEGGATLDLAHGRTATLGLDPASRSPVLPRGPAPVEHPSKKFPGMRAKRSITPTRFQISPLYPDVERRRVPKSWRDLGQSGPTPDAWSGARVPAEPELPAWRLFSLPPLRCPGARGEGGATLDLAHGRTATLGLDPASRSPVLPRGPAPVQVPVAAQQLVFVK
ncbi:uncharacterized protein AAG666_002077 [Megaptera novaeangliae]